MLKIAIFLFAFISMVLGAIPSHKVHHLPGWPKSSDTLPGTSNYTLPFEVYSGYLNVTYGDMFYMFFTCSKCENPQDAPVTLWLTGGPGCSSMLGLFTEMGPLYPDGENPPNLYENPQTWIQFANMIFLESPGGVGFSIDKLDGTWTDNITAVTNYEFLVEFFTNYPEYADNDFFIATESYGGHYGPTLTWEIIQQNMYHDYSNMTINLKKTSIGNPATDAEFDGHGLRMFYEDNGLNSMNEDYNTNDFGFINPYDILQDTSCNPMPYRLYDEHSKYFAKALEESSTKKSIVGDRALPHIHEFGNDMSYLADERLQQLKREMDMSKRHTPSTKVPNKPPCIDSYVSSYLNQDDVKKAIHADPSITWELCSASISYEFGGSMLPVYKNILENSDVDLMVYSGTADGVCPMQGTQLCMLKLAGDGEIYPENYWQWWGPSIEFVYGYGTRFKNMNEGRNSTLTYLTVTGSGHEVPWYQPQFITAIERFWTGQEMFGNVTTLSIHQ